jgi:hypothetical protein
MKKKILEFWTKHEFLDKDVAPTKTVVPDWYKQTEKIVLDLPQEQIIKGLKSCAPFLDALTSGYVLKTSQDIRVTYGNDGLYYFQWNVDKAGVEVQVRDSANPVPIPTGYANENLVWYSPFTFRLPKGYSVLMTHPLNRTDLPFMSLSGIVDGDSGITSGSYPFFLKEGFSGIIPAGTPFVQCIPFKRDNWKSNWVPELEQIEKKNSWLSRRVNTGWYKSTIWNKKTYE